MLKRGTLLLLWGLTLLWSFHSGRLDLLLRGVFHGLVGVTGLVLLMLGVACLLYTSPSPRDVEESRMPSSA